ncbi:MAG: hypothetical protein A2Z46_03790 [Nitrospirae bacterium RBG_19FT_COMBO_55_12]|nr:MAG: hypothetical protein A2Z46_03790 [Nitrospirae bacterium RBG_19FT_COMBO_55_12]
MRLDPGQIEVLDDAMADVLRGKLPSQRIQIGFDIWTSAHNMLMVHIRKTHPDWDEKKVGQEVARRLLHGAI